MNNTQKNLKDAKLVISEHNRLQDQIAQHKGLKGIHEEDIKSFIQSDDGSLCFCSKEGRKALRKILQREYDARQEINSTVLEEDFTTIATKMFAQAFLVKKEPITESSLAKAINSAYKILRSKYEETTHFIPCYLFSHADPKEFKIGSVRFIHVSIFQNEYDQLFQKHISDGSETNNTASPNSKKIVEQVLGKKWSSKSEPVKNRHLRLVNYKARQKLLALYKSSYLEYTWIAVIEVAPCHKDLARHIAESACEQSINVLRLMLHEPYNERLRLSFDTRVRNETLQISLDGKAPHYIHSTGSAESIQDGWYPYIWSTNGKRFMDIFDVVIGDITSLNNHSPVKERLYDALTWYGQALAETSPGLKIVKLISAIERLTLTGEKEGISETVTNRAANLMQAVWLEDQKDNLKRYYTLRSKLVHGERSPSDYSIKRDLFQVSSLCRKVILAATDFYGAIGLDKELTVKQLRKCYESLDYPQREPSHKQKLVKLLRFLNFKKIGRTYVRQSHG